MCAYLPLVWSGVLLDFWISSGNLDAVSGCTLQVESAEIKVKGTVQKVVFCVVRSCEGTEQHNECYYFRNNGIT